MPSDRTKKEVAYENPQKFDYLVDQSLDDTEYFKRLDAIDSAFSSLVEAKMIISKGQFASVLSTMQGVPVPICDAAGICQITREYWRVLEKRKKIKIIRSNTGKRCFIKSADIIKYLKGKL